MSSINNQGDRSRAGKGGRGWGGGGDCLLTFQAAPLF